MFYRDLLQSVKVLEFFEKEVERFVSEVHNKDDYTYSKELTYLINANPLTELEKMVTIIKNVSNRAKVESPVWI